MKSIRWMKQGPPVSNEQIGQFEVRNNLALDSSYKKFLLEINGGEPTPDRLLIPGWHGGSTAINRFFGLEEKGSYDLENSLQNVEEYVPSGFVPIGEDSGGNLLCLGTVGTYSGKVYFWDHEEVQGVNPQKLIEVAANFEELLDSLLPLDD